MSTHDDTFEIAPRDALRKLIGGLIALLAVVALLGLTLRGPIEAWSGAFVGRFGLRGVFFGVFLLDLLPVGTHDPMLFAGYSGGLAYTPLCLAGMTAAAIAPCCDWAMGRLLGERIPALRRLAERFRIPQLLARYGGRAIAVAAVLPLPFSLVAWVSGMSGGSATLIAAGSALRATKVALTLALIAVGWGVGG